MKYQFMQQHRTHIALAVLCRVCQVSQSGYYAWCRRPRSARAQRDQQLTQEMQKIHEQSRYPYGSPRVYAELQAQGISCNEKRIARLMQRNGLKARERRRYQVPTNSRHGLPVAENLLAQQFGVGQINRTWAGDIICI